MGVALVMREEDAVARKLLRVAAGDEIDEEAAVADPVDRRGLAGEMGRRRQARAQRGEKRSRSVWVASAAATIQGSSQCEPTGISAPPKPRRSAACAICLR